MKKRGGLRARNKHTCYWKVFSNVILVGLGAWRSKAMSHTSEIRESRRSDLQSQNWWHFPELTWTTEEFESPWALWAHTATRHHQPRCGFVFVSGFWCQVQWQHGLRKRAPWLGNSALHYQVLQISCISPVIYAPSKHKYILPKWIIFRSRNLKSRSRKDL